MLSFKTTSLTITTTPVTIIIIAIISFIKNKFSEKSWKLRSHD